MSRFMIIINVIIAAARSFLRNQAVVEAIKEAAIAAAAHTEWGDGERTEFVINAGRAVVRATPSPIDDLIYEVLAKLYVTKYTTVTKLEEAHPHLATFE